MPDTPEETNVIRVEIDLDQLTREANARWDDEGSRIGPSSLLELIVDEAARKLAERALDTEIKEDYRSLKERVRRTTDETIRGHVEPLIQQALDQVADERLHPRPRHYGDSDTPEPRTLDQVVVDTAKKWLTEKVSTGSHYNDPQVPRVTGFIKGAVDRSIKNELQKALDEGKEQVRKALQAQGAQLLQEAIERQAAGR